MDEICLESSAVMAWAEQFSFCVFVRLAGPAQDASLLRFHTPEGGVVEAGTKSNGVYLRVKPGSPQRQRRSPNVPSMYANVADDDLNIVIQKSKKGQPEGQVRPRSSTNDSPDGENGISGLAIDDKVRQYYFRQPNGDQNVHVAEDERKGKLDFEVAIDNQTHMYDDYVQNEPTDFNEETRVNEMNRTELVNINGHNSSHHDIYKTESGSETIFSGPKLDLLNESSSVVGASGPLGPENPSPESFPGLNNSDYGEQSVGSGDFQYFTNQREENEVFGSNTAFTLFVFEATLSPLTWHHLCLIYDEITNKAICQIDGTSEQISYSKEEYISSLEELQISENSSMCIGSENFDGDLLGLETFRAILWPEQNMTYYPCQNESFSSVEAEITMSSPWMLPENTSLSEFYKSDICLEENFQRIVLYKVGGYHKTLQYCEALGGHLPSLEEISLKTVEVINKRKTDDDEDIDYISWLNTKHNEQNLSSLKCRALTSDVTETEISCVKRLRASICITMKHRVTLYGHQGTHFDHFFYSGIVKDEIKWTGLQQSHVRRESSYWVLESPFHLTKLYLFNKTLPIGRHEWVSMTSLNATSTLLTLTLCKTYEFSCNDGSCLPIAQRCDDIVQCRDHSDEVNCNVLSLPSSYQKFYEPPPRPGEILPSILYYDVDVYHMGTITTDEGKASMDVAVSVAWFDPRLNFNNLKIGKKNYFNCTKVWKPSIRTITGNGDGSVVMTNFYEEQCYTKPTNQQPSRNLTDPWMGHSASGLRYPLQYYIGLRTTIPCDFHLERYPFDRQICNVSFMIMNAPGSRVFSRNKEGILVRYLNKKRLLLEYELVNLTTESGTSLQGQDNNSYFLVSYHMERLYGYHIMNSFFPSLLIALVSYSTFYFKINDFYDRILVSLTAHFILASQFIAVTTNSTKTPYLKLIDVWYVVIMTFCFIVIIVQVGINALMHCQKFPAWLRDRFKMFRLSSRKVAPAADKPVLDDTVNALRNAAHTSKVTHGMSSTTRRISRFPGFTVPESTIPEVDDCRLSPMDAYGHMQKNNIDVLELDEVLHHDQTPDSMKCKRNSIMSLAKFSTRLPVSKILAIAALQPNRDSQAKQNLNKVGPAVASAKLANFIAQVLMLAFIFGLLITYFLVVTNFLD
ncbi:Low-density lipoprotein (LDL) receptor class A repeat [Trinorchestia longiramus]|nr:Low-density lipoprotein (LDL) receptor class A repeat [Trinorchestia longiramus]